jgi:3-hydroxybutyrate dehydrogenase
MLKGKSAVVTGSTSGIGLGIARVLASKGVNIMLNGFGDAAEIETIRSGLESEFGVRAAYNAADISKPSAIKEMIDTTVETFGSIDVLVSNAGIQFTAAIEDFPEDKWNAIIAINLSGVFWGMHYALPYMRKQGWGRLINIASAHGLVASPHKSAYVAAKHGVVGLTKVAALETAETDITANAICPGWVLTPLVEKQIKDMAARDGISEKDAELKLLSEKQPSKKFTTPEELGELAAFLCTDAAAQITGVPLPVDGGWTAQ